MKVKAGKEKGFKPVDLIITFESHKEAQFFYSLFNHSAITEVAFKFGINDNAIRTELRELVPSIITGANVEEWQAIKKMLEDYNKGS